MWSARSAGVRDGGVRLGVGTWTRVSLNVVALGAPHRHADKVATSNRGNKDSIRRIIAKLQVQRAPRHGGFQARLVARDEERVRALLDALQASEKCGVPRSGGHRRDTPTQVFLQATGLDHKACGVTISSRALFGDGVQGKHLARLEQGLIHARGSLANVLVSIRGIGEGLRESGNLFDHPQLLRILRSKCRRLSGQSNIGHPI